MAKNEKEKPRYNSVEIVLDAPIEIGGVKINKLTMRRPKLKDRLMIDKQNGLSTDIDRELALFGNLCEVSAQELEDLDMNDYYKVQEAYAGFRNSLPLAT